VDGEIGPAPRPKKGSPLTGFVNLPRGRIIEGSIIMGKPVGQKPDPQTQQKNHAKETYKERTGARADS